LAQRKISLCAGYFLLEATRLLSSGDYDSCISFASGFSLLIYLIARKNAAYTNIKYFDTDFPHMIKERNERIDAIRSELDQTILARIQCKAFDIEKAYQQNRKLKDVFPNCHRPIFIADGVSYFLTPGCANWLIEQMGTYEQSAAMMYYWPDDMLQKSSLFAKVFEDLNKGMILASLKSFWDDSTIAKFKAQFPYTSDRAIADVDEMISNMQIPALEPELTNPNQYFPVRLIMGEKRESMR